MRLPWLFLVAAASKLSNPATYPWTMVAGTIYETEGAVVARYVADRFPQAKIAFLYQDDDAGKAVIAGFRATLGPLTSQIVSEQTYVVTDPTVDSQIIAMQASGADLVYLITIPKFGSQALRRMNTLQWKPHTILGQGNSSVRSTLEPVGFENVQGVVAPSTRQDPGNPVWADTPDMKAYMAFVDKYAPTINRFDDWYPAGYSIAVMTAHVLRQCGDNLTRKNVLHEATSLHNYAEPLLIPGITVNTSPTDYVPVKQFQMMRFTGKSYERLGEIISAT